MSLSLGNAVGASDANPDYSSTRTTGPDNRFESETRHTERPSSTSNLPTTYMKPFQGSQELISKSGTMTRPVDRDRLKSVDVLITQF